MRRWKTQLLLAVFALSGLFGAAPAATQGIEYDRNILVLVAPLRVGGEIRDDFGRKVSDRVRKALETFPGLDPLDKNDVKRELEQLGLRESDLSPIQWRQIASRLGAQGVMEGEARGGAGGVSVTVRFVVVESGEEFLVPPIALDTDRGDAIQDASASILAAFEQHVTLQQSIGFCRDYLSGKYYDEARANCDRALEMSPNSATALYLRGRLEMELENWTAAEADLEGALSIDGAHAEALQSLAFTFAQLGNTQRATELYGEYLAYKPNDVNTRLRLAHDLATAGAYDAAIALVEGGIARDSSSAAMWSFLGTVALFKSSHRGDGAATGSDPAGATSGAETPRDSTALALAVLSFDWLIALRGDEIEAEDLRKALGANLSLGQLDRALEISDAAMRLAPNEAALWASRADVLARLGRPAEAVEALDSALISDPNYPNAWLRRGLYSLAAGDPAQAVADLQTAIEAGDDPEIVASQLLSRGHRDHFQAGDYQSAVETFGIGLQIAPEGEVRQQLSFFTAYGLYQQGVALDEANNAEACGPARRALDSFRSAGQYLTDAGNYQPASQGQLVESTDIYIYRQEQIIRKSC